jgi:ribosomal protein L7/L12
VNTQEIIDQLQWALDHPMAAGRIIRDLIETLSNPATVAVYRSPDDDDAVFDVVMTSPGPSKIMVIKTIREILQCGLKESKEMTDPDALGRFKHKTIKSRIRFEEAVEISQKLERNGASVTVARHTS